MKQQKTRINLKYNIGNFLNFGGGIGAIILSVPIGMATSHALFIDDINKDTVGTEIASEVKAHHKKQFSELKRLKLELQKEHINKDIYKIDNSVSDKSIKEKISTLKKAFDDKAVSSVLDLYTYGMRGNEAALSEVDFNDLHVDYNKIAPNTMEKLGLDKKIESGLLDESISDMTALNNNSNNIEKLQWAKDLNALMNVDNEEVQAPKFIVSILLITTVIMLGLIGLGEKFSDEPARKTVKRRRRNKHLSNY